MEDGRLLWSYRAAADPDEPQYAIAGDRLLVPDGSFIAPSSDTQGKPPTNAPSVIAFRLGSGEATPAS